MFRYSARMSRELMLHYRIFCAYEEIVKDSIIELHQNKKYFVFNTLQFTSKRLHQNKKYFTIYIK